MYLIIGIILTVLSVVELSGKRAGMDNIFKACWLLMTLVLCFRFGQGQDYFSYMWLYNTVDAGGSYWINQLGHGELGWYMLNLLFVRMGLPFEYLIGFISLVMMLCVYIAINKYSPYKILSLLLFYPEYYMTYCCSGIRQGLAICLFLAFLVPLLIKREYRFYYLGVILLMSLHMASAILLVIPLFLKLQLRKSWIYVAVAAVFSVFIVVSGLVASILTNVTGSDGYAKGSDSIAGVLYRIVMFAIIYLLFVKTQDRTGNTLFSIYYCGLLIFMSLMPLALISQRLSVTLKSVEILMIPQLLYYRFSDFKLNRIKHNPVYLAIAMILVANVMLLKNINGYIQQGKYYSHVTILNYPYITVFDRDEIYEYREVFFEELVN